jgi:PAS domain S-box-containing protein
MGLTLKQLSAKSGYGVSTINNFENGRAGGSQEFLSRISEILRVPISEILRDPGHGGMKYPRPEEEIGPHLRFDYGTQEGSRAALNWVLEKMPLPDLIRRLSEILSDDSQEVGRRLEMARSIMPVIERRKFELEAQESNMPLVTTDATGKIIHVNRPFSAMCGYSLAELKGKKPGEVLQGKATEQKEVREFRQAIQERRPHECTMTNYMRDGTAYRVHIKMFPVFDAGGELVQFKAIEEKIS